jgi:DNA polymerase I-like protein with 3'-5' exonuclease and polymerase domains
MYIPDSPRHCFLEYDYSQAELRVIAAVSHDLKLQETLNTSDFHQVTADRLGIPRPIAKNTIYASSYLGGAGTIQKMMKRKGHFAELKAIKRAQALLRQEYTRMFAWQATTIAQGQASGYLINAFGRVRFFYDKENDAPEMADYIPQSTVADITWYVLGQLVVAARKYGGRVVTLVHDSFLFQVLEEHIEAARAEFRAIMEQKFDNVAPGFWLPTECKVGTPGQSWGDLLKEAA